MLLLNAKQKLFCRAIYNEVVLIAVYTKYVAQHHIFWGREGILTQLEEEVSWHCLLDCSTDLLNNNCKHYGPFDSLFLTVDYLSCL